MIIRFSPNQGANLALQPMLLPDSVGVSSTNNKPGRGDFRPWNAPLNKATVPAGRKTIFRMGRDVVSDVNYWLSWPTVVHAVVGGNATDTSERTYYTGSGAPKWTDTTKALPVGSDSNAGARLLGVPAPTGVIVLAAAGGVSTLTEDRFYTYTYVSDIGEEGAPNPAPTQITCKTDDVVTISALAAAPSGNYGVNRIRIYRTQAGTSGGADFYFLRELGTVTSVDATALSVGTVYTIASLGTTNFALCGASSNAVGVQFTATAIGAGTGTASFTTLTTADTTDDNRSLGEVMTTTTWLPPDAGMTWLTGLWNGMMAGISGRAVRFCEAYTYYAWPIAYEILPTNAKPVALATFGQTLVMLTDGNPSIITGGSPESMDEQPVEVYQSCIAPLSAVGMGHGVAWASPDGLAYVGSGGARLLTTGIMTRDDWQALNPSTIQACMYEGRYFGFYNNGTVKCFIFDPANTSGMTFLDFGADAVHVDALQDALFVLNGIDIQKFDAGAAKTATFKSKVFRQSKPVPGFACAEVVGSQTVDNPATFKLYVDGNATPKHTQSVTSTTPFRLPSGYHAQDFQIEVSTTSSIQGVALAHAMKELAST